MYGELIFPANTWGLNYPVRNRLCSFRIFIKSTSSLYKEE